MTGRWLQSLFEPRAEPRSDERAWRADPLSHPAIARMNARELADLPLSAEPRRRPGAATGCGRRSADR